MYLHHTSATAKNETWELTFILPFADRGDGTRGFVHLSKMSFSYVS